MTLVTRGMGRNTNFFTATLVAAGLGVSLLAAQVPVPIVPEFLTESRLTTPIEFTIAGVRERAELSVALVGYFKESVGFTFVEPTPIFPVTTLEFGFYQSADLTTLEIVDQSISRYYDSLQDIRYKEDEALLLHTSILDRTIIDPELLSKISTTTYYNVYRDTESVGISLVDKSIYSGSHTWLEKLQQEDEEILLLKLLKK